MPSGAQVSASGKKEESGVTCVNIAIAQASSEYANVGFASQEKEATYENFGNKQQVIVYIGKSNYVNKRIFSWELLKVLASLPE